MAILTKAEILAHRVLKRETVAVPAWGGEVVLQELTGTQRDAMEADMVVLRQQQERGAVSGELITRFRLLMLRYSLVDEAGQQLFSADEIAALGGQSGAVLGELYEKAMQLSGMKKADVEELTKN